MLKTLRRWLAWKLRQLSIRLNDCRYSEQVTVTTQAGIILDIRVESDTYGEGIFHFDPSPPPEIVIARNVLSPPVNQPPD